MHLTDRRARNLLLGLAAMFVSLTPGVLGAQVVRGVVTDSINAVLLPGVTVELLSPQSVVGKAVSDDSGKFVLQVPASGRYRFRVRQIGYHNYLSPAIPIDASRDATITLPLASLPVAIEPLSISASSQVYLQNAGFYERKQSDPGFFMLPDAVGRAATKAHQTADILDGIPGVTLVVAGGSRGIRIPQFTSRSGIGCDNGPRIYLDNNLMNPGDDPFDVNTIQPADLLAIEVYRKMVEVPLKYGGTQASCGALVFWTKH